MRNEEETTDTAAEDTAPPKKGGKKKAAKKTGKKAKGNGADKPKLTKEERQARRAAREASGEIKKRWRAPKGVLVTFMTALLPIAMKTIPAKPKDQAKLSQSIRQMAEKLARQTRRSGDEDITFGGGGSEDDDGGEEE